MKRTFVILLVFLSLFSLFATNNKKPGVNIPKQYKFSETEAKQVEHSINILMEPGSLPEGFDGFTLTPEEARALTKCSPKEIQKAVKTIGDARLYILVSGMIQNSSVHTGDSTHDGKQILLNNQCFDCGRWASLYCYLLFDDYDEVGITIIRGSERDMTVPEKCYLSHWFSWVKKDGRYCFFNLQGQDDEPWRKIRAVDNINDFVHQMPAFWGKKTIDFVYMYRATPKYFACSNTDLGEFEVKTAKNSKGYLKVLYKNPNQNWHFTYNVEPKNSSIYYGEELEISDEVITSSTIEYTTVTRALDVSKYTHTFKDSMNFQ